MIDGFREIRLQDPEQGELLLVVALPTKTSTWGILAPLRGTPWEQIIRVVPGSALSHALHGFATPLVRVLGPNPHQIGKRLNVRDAQCAQSKACATAGPACRVGLNVPDCYEPPRIDAVAAFVALLLRDGWHVLVVDGPEFSVP